MAGENKSYWDLGDEEEEEAISSAITLYTDCIKFEVLKAIIDLNVLEIIKNCGPNGHLSAAEIVAELPTNNAEVAVAILGRLLDFLVSHSILTTSLISLTDGRVEKRYGLAPICKFFIPNEAGVSLAPMTYTSIYKSLKESSLCLKDAVLEGKEPFTKAYGLTMYEHINVNPVFGKDFYDLMSNHSTLLMHKLLRKYKGFEGISTLVDVGGGHGTALKMIITQYPTIKGINFDLPHIIADAPLYSGVENVGGDMFVEIPKCDAIFLKWICHCFNDKQCISILKNCYAALPDNNGKVIICEYVLPEPHETVHNRAANAAIQFDIIMMVQPAGKERSIKEYEALANAAGFQTFQVICSAYNMNIMELGKKN